jgi:hypothetical protein
VLSGCGRSSGQAVPPSIDRRTSERAVVLLVEEIACLVEDQDDRSFLVASSYEQIWQSGGGGPTTLHVAARARCSLPVTPCCRRCGSSGGGIWMENTSSYASDTLESGEAGARTAGG